MGQRSDKFIFNSTLITQIKLEIFIRWVLFVTRESSPLVILQRPSHPTNGITKICKTPNQFLLDTIPSLVQTSPQGKSLPSPQDSISAIVNVQNSHFPGEHHPRNKVNVHINCNQEPCRNWDRPSYTQFLTISQNKQSDCKLKASHL